MKKRTRIVLLIIVLLGAIPIFWIFQDSEDTTKKPPTIDALAQGYCGSCHLKPEPGSIPTYYWRDYVLPKMGEFLGTNGPLFNPYSGLDPVEANILKSANIFPTQPLIDSAHWADIVDYYLKNSPDSIQSDLSRNDRSEKLELFQATKYSIATRSATSMVTGIKYDSLSGELWIGDGFNKVHIWKKDTGLIRAFSTKSPVIDFDFTGEWKAMTEIGILFPSDKSEGFMTSPINKDSLRVIIPNLQRPVYTDFHDFNGDGTDEIIVCNFGNYTGSFNIYSLSETKYTSIFELSQPGAIKASIRDMNKDGKDDIVVLFAQSDESVYILYQTDDLQFRTERVLRFPPQYGSSDLAVIDFNKDGYYDIITVQGDNADYSYFTKPYHGLRIFLNDQKNNFSEAHFTPIYGATRLQTDDFDGDGDYDFAVLSTFPDFENLAHENFVYLENNSSEEKYSFIIRTPTLETLTHAITLEKADLDQDGDKDLIIGAFNASPVPVPSFVRTSWNKPGTEILILENQLFQSEN
ncbi:VCBS repeat-containing protein [Fulvivirga sp. M361]|uniref:FG-GAP repeat domain-containing protein n=1 Tax=Fulvivirga sp. M361 TaxID=2594266 RepID=UPI00117A7376|nr:VCBS repeat-containing protein [Fulvivirga sp. M361]TRX53370.1 VCBS repeat-containing protein [Fulvivirga sp. M361]